MEQAHRFLALGPGAVGKRGLEWDLNDWKWDGDLFIATPSDPRPSTQFVPVVGIGNSSNSSSSCSEDGIHNARIEFERKRRVIVVDEDSMDDAASLSLNLGGTNCEVTTSGKKTKVVGAVCQVQDCGADLTKAKDYHRRHKVCEVHSKATQALVANLMQRFCQQCSRFHVLKEFDEGKRSCRRRLAGHNKRRRKTQPDPAAHGNSTNQDQTNSVLLLSLLKILSNVHANKKPDQVTDQDLVSQLLRSLANSSGLHTGNGVTGLLHDSQKLLNGGMLNGHSAKMSDFLTNNRKNHSRVVHRDLLLPVPDSEIPGKGVHAVDSTGVDMQPTPSQKPGIMFPVKESPPSESTTGRMKMNNFDLNDIYVDSDDGTDDLERSPVNVNFATSSPDIPSWIRHDSHQSSPPQTSGNSDSASAQSPSSSSGEGQSCTDRIVFKLFGKEPSDFPLVLRSQTRLYNFDNLSAIG